MAAARTADRSRLWEVEAEIETLEAQLAVLRRERDQVRGRLDEYTYPVLTLPDEIITEIFTQYLPPYPDFPPLVGSGSPTFLLGICRLWRSIALQSPGLWRAIKLDCKVYPERVEVAQTWLQRSGASPLSVHLDFASNFQVAEAEDSLLNALVAQRSRWEYIHIGGPSQIHLLSDPSSSLVRLYLSTRFPSNRDIISFHHAHRLRSVCLRNVGYDLNSLPWGQLTSLTLMNIFLVDCASILPTATNLVRCKLYIRNTDIVGLGGAHCELPRLEILLLQSLVKTQDSCLSAFTLPSLRKLEISDGLLGEHAVEQLKSFLARSTCRLERLRIMSSRPRPTVWTAPCRIAFPDVVVDDCARFSESASSLNDRWKTEEYWDVAPVLVEPV